MSVLERLERPWLWSKRHRMLTATVAFLVLAGATAYNFSVGDAQLGKIEDGRRAGTQLNCAIATAVIAAGRETIERASSAPLPPKLEALFTQLGFPSKEVRETGARVEAQAYARKINAGIEDATHVHSARILKPDGTVDCAQLRKIARVN